MKEEIKKILLETLTSNYDNGNIENGGIGGGDEAIERLDRLFQNVMLQAALHGLSCAQISSRGDCATFPPSVTCEPQSHNE